MYKEDSIEKEEEEDGGTNNQRAFRWSLPSSWRGAISAGIEVARNFAGSLCGLLCGFPVSGLPPPASLKRPSLYYRVQRRRVSCIVIDDGNKHSA
jgi:hypothetical protein